MYLIPINAMVAPQYFILSASCPLFDCLFDGEQAACVALLM